MKAAQIPKAGADFQIVEREIPKPGAGQVLIKVQAAVYATVSAGTAARTERVPHAGGRFPQLPEP